MYATAATLADYDAMGEFHDLFMDRPHRLLRPALQTAFGGLGPDAVVLDLGAGTGLGVRHLAQVSDARIIAVEPSLTMRAVLLARVADNPVLAARVSVVNGCVPEVFDRLPGTVAGFMVTNMLGHLSLADRTAMFTALSERLQVGGAGVVTVSAAMPADGRVATPEPLSEERQIGEHRYLVRHLPRPDGGYDSVYEVRTRDGRMVRAARFAGAWTPVTADLLSGELEPAGWRVHALQPPTTLLLIRASGSGVVETLQREQGAPQIRGGELGAGDLVERLGRRDGRIGARVEELPGGQ